MEKGVGPLINDFFLHHIVKLHIERIQLYVFWVGKGPVKLLGPSRIVGMTRRLLLSMTASIFWVEWSHALSDPQLKVQQQAPFVLGHVEGVSLGEMSAATPFVLSSFGLFGTTTKRWPCGANHTWRILSAIPQHGFEFTERGRGLPHQCAPSVLCKAKPSSITCGIRVLKHYTTVCKIL